MRSLANDIREGCKLSKYKVSGVLLDGKGGHCAMGAAFLGAGVSDRYGESAMMPTRYPVFWFEQCITGITYEAVRKNNYTPDTREEIADWVEQQEWERLGIPTRAMKAELAKEQVKV